MAAEVLLTSRIYECFQACLDLCSLFFYASFDRGGVARSCEMWENMVSKNKNWYEIMIFAL